MSQNFEFPSVPYSAFIGITYACNCNCKHCYARDRINSSRKALQKDDFFRLFEMLSKMGTLSITYTHGEALLHPDLEELLRYAHQLGLRQVLISNGILMNSKNIAILEKQRVEAVLLSLDSSKPLEHDINRGRKGCYTALNKAMRLLQASKIPSRGLAVTVSLRNQDQLGAIIDEAINNKMDFISLLSERNGSLLSEPELPVLLEAITKYKNKIDIITHDLRLLQHVDSINFSDKKERDLFHDDNMCHCFKNQLSIDMYGDVRPCNFVNKIYGNCLSKRISAIWNDILEDANSGLQYCCKGG